MKLEINLESIITETIKKHLKQDIESALNDLDFSAKWKIKSLVESKVKSIIKQSPEVEKFLTEWVLLEMKVMKQKELGI